MLAALVLLGMVVLVAYTNRARDAALAGSATPMSHPADPQHRRHHRPLRGRARPLRARRGRRTSGTAITTNGGSPGWQIGQLDGWSRPIPAQRARADELQALYSASAAPSSAPAARAAGASRATAAASAALSPPPSSTDPASSARQARGDRRAERPVAVAEDGRDPGLRRPAPTADRLARLARRPDRLRRHLPRLVAVQALRQKARRAARGRDASRRALDCSSRRCASAPASCATPTRR